MPTELPKSPGKSHRKPTGIDLFAGCGGLTAGLKNAGYNVLAAVEIDERARETYSLNHPEVIFAGEDIREVDPARVMEQLGIKEGELDLLAGCPPCQGFSRMRKLNRTRAARDNRNSLIDEFARFVTVLKPKLVMMENVPGLEDHYRFGDLVAQLKSMKYYVHFEVLDVANYGVPQRRKRLILVASKKLMPKLATPNVKRKNVRQTIGNLSEPGRSRDPVHNIPERRTPRVQAIIRAIPLDGGSRSQLPAELRLKCHESTTGFKDVYGRMAWSEVSPTITGGCHNPSKGRFLHPEQNRTITLREAAMLQGFPKNYKFNVSHGKEAIALMIGNALPPPFIEAHARALRRSL
ncbi:DNA cytosine methyltransferase [Herbaspirillum huttiense]|uniref:DNA cytosine methyltransferase n=1 Tax=Herbaspirillum huttiense TaxID=863372 RepID=UPI0039B05651